MAEIDKTIEGLKHLLSLLTELDKELASRPQATTVMPTQPQRGGLVIPINQRKGRASA